MVDSSGDGVGASAHGRYGQESGFRLQSVPEPCSLLMLPLGLIGVVLGRVTERRPGSRGHTGR